jgi:hypothetical protein
MELPVGDEAGRNVLLRDGELRNNLIFMTSNSKAVMYEFQATHISNAFYTEKNTILSHRLHLVPSFYGHLHPLHLPLERH